jgi:hypothetical protein
MNLPAHIRLAADGWLGLDVEQLPDLDAHARTIRSSHILQDLFLEGLIYDS